LTSADYTAAYLQVKALGGNGTTTPSTRTPEQTEIALFWSGLVPGGNVSNAGVAIWNQITETVSKAHDLTLADNARLYAEVGVAIADAFIASFDTKYAYNFWRPVTAIRWPDDGNPSTASDPAWRPFLVTPPYPDYPCALPTATAAATEVLREFLGRDDIGFTRTHNAPAVALPAPMAPLPAKAITRTFHSLSQAAAESRDARVFAGIHFREGCEAGARQGSQVGRFVVGHELRRLKGR
jgi:hypothetical protein